mgnify:CR=1 FL=1
MSELLNDWTHIAVSRVCTTVRGVTYNKLESSGEQLPNYLPVLRANNIQAGKLIFSDLVYVPKNCISTHQLIKAGDVVVAMSSGSKSVVGKAAKAGSDWAGSFGAFCGVLRPNSEIDPEYFYFFTQSAEYRSRVSELSAGVNINNLKPTHFDLIEMPIAPRAEQTRIAQKLSELLVQVDSIKTRVDAVPALLKRFRQSILAAAVAGRLTEKPHGQSEPENRSTKTALGNLICEMRNGLSTKPNEDEKGLPILRISAVRTGSVDLEDVRFLECSDAEKNRYSLKAGDLLFTRYNGSLELVGVCGLIRQIPHANLVYPDKLIRVRCNTNFVLPKYLEIFFAAPSTRQQVMELVKSTSGQKGISGQDLKDFVVTYPSLMEQTDVILRVEQLFAFADQLEAKVTSAKSRIDFLTQSILAKAFRGELVPQDPNDEPASLLLGRIKAQRTAKPKTSRTKKSA